MYSNHTMTRLIKDVHTNHAMISPITFTPIRPAGVLLVLQRLVTHWHSEAINKATQIGDEKFNKLEFLNAFNDFRAKAFKSTTIRSAWRQTGLIPYNPVLVLDKVREAHPPAPPRPATPSPTSSSPYSALRIQFASLPEPQLQFL